MNEYKTQNTNRKAKKMKREKSIITSIHWYIESLICAKKQKDETKKKQK